MFTKRFHVEFRAKHVVFAFIAAMAAYVVYHNESFLIDATHPVWHLGRRAFRKSI